MSTPLEQFLAEHVHRAPGHLLPFAEFRTAFHAWCSPEESYDYTAQRLSRELREFFQVGAYGSGGHIHVANCSLTAASPKPVVWTQHGRRLVRKRSKAKGNLRLQDLLPILNRLRDKSPERIASYLNERGKRNWRGNKFHPNHIKRLLETIV